MTQSLSALLLGSPALQSVKVLGSDGSTHAHVPSFTRSFKPIQAIRPPAKQPTKRFSSSEAIVARRPPFSAQATSAAAKLRAVSKYFRHFLEFGKEDEEANEADDVDYHGGQHEEALYIIFCGKV